MNSWQWPVRLRQTVTVLTVAVVVSAPFVAWSSWRTADDRGIARPADAVTASPSPSGVVYIAGSGGGHAYGGSCTPRVMDGLYLPDPSCTPGAPNPDVTQDTIRWTICRRGWVAALRRRDLPLIQVESLKTWLVAEYGNYAGLARRDYELDQLISLNLGGAIQNPRNLWPQNPPAQNWKDDVEAAANRKVCKKFMTLADAQDRIVHDPIGLGVDLGVLRLVGGQVRVVKGSSAGDGD